MQQAKQKQNTVHLSKSTSRPRSLMVENHHQRMKTVFGYGRGAVAVE